MKINVNKFYLVAKEALVNETHNFPERAISLSELKELFDTGLNPKEIAGLFTTKREAEKEADRLTINNYRQSKFSTVENKTSSNLYAIVSVNNELKAKRRFASEKEVQQYLDKMYELGEWLKAIRIGSSTKKLPAGKLKQLQDKIGKHQNSLTPKDLYKFELLFQSLKDRPATEAMIVIDRHFDTYLRDLIPPTIYSYILG